MACVVHRRIRIAIKSCTYVELFSERGQKKGGRPGKVQLSSNFPRSAPLAISRFSAESSTYVELFAACRLDIDLLKLKILEICMCMELFNAHFDGVRVCSGR